MINERFIEKNVKGRGRSLFEVLSLDLLEVTQESHVRIANVPRMRFEPITSGISVYRVTSTSKPSVGW
jgi:hypothetical protein